MHALWRSGIPTAVRRQVWPLAIGNRLELGRADYAKVLDLVQSSELTVKGVDLIDCDVARTRLKGCGEDGASVCHAQLALLLRAVSALRPAEGYVQVACLVSALCVFLRVTVRQV